jgi:uncharacterized spore protein YtfJ
MDNPADQLIHTIMDSLKTVATTKSIIGEPVTVADQTIIPICKLCLGFGAGGGTGEAKEKVGAGAASGGGGGLKIEPVAFLIIHADKVSILTTKEPKRFNAIFEAIPTLIEKLQRTKEKNKEEEKPE